MRIALINSGLGLLGAAAVLRRQQPDADLILAMDPDGMPWGPRPPAEIAQRSLDCAYAARAHEPDVLVVACNTGSVHALDVLREHFEPDLPVVGTVPAIKPAASSGRPVAIWATVATTGSVYQRGLIEQFAAGVPVAEVACPGLADAIHAGDEAQIDAAVAAAARRTPPGTHAVVLGCTEYELAADRIGAALPGVTLFGSANAVATQALRRASRPPAAGPAAPAGSPPPGSGPAAPAASAAASAGLAGPAIGPTAGPAAGLTTGPRTSGPHQRAGRPVPAASPAGLPVVEAAPPGEVIVLLSGRRGPLPPAALLYPQGRLLAGAQGEQCARRPAEPVRGR